MVAASCGSSGNTGGAGSEAGSGPPQPVSAATLNTALAQGVQQAGAPGAQGALYACGHLAWSGVDGVTDRATGNLVTPDTRYVLQSVTKMFTATMIMLLVQAGKLSLDTPLAQFYPQVPDASTITVKMLLDHRSGLPEYLDDPVIQTDFNDPEHVWSRDQVIASLHTAAFAPGIKYSYTNSNYVVLGGLLEMVSGASVESDFQTDIALPLALADTSFVSPPSDSDVFAHPYSYDDGSTATDQWVPGYGISSGTVGPVWTDGGLISTATDIAHFGDALFDGRLVAPATLAQMTTIDGDGEGLGPESSTYDGRTWLGHSGDYGGFESELWHDASRDITLTVTTNMDEPSSAGMTTSATIWDAVASAIDGAEPAYEPCP